ncbi:sulfur carrier protein ThiS [Corynebacterium lubricantis]|uniref:sulfur carrier protein ThiS n=1 Tax=Corynebacterium lubricantis TaxID=541095 RepID=UPI00036D1621|nr:sulfur carrier protein ThiS [Corynebacterium lubricantis]
MITYTVNDQSTESAPLTVAELVAQRVGSETGVAVAIGGAVVPRSAWSREIQPGDTVDILTAVQGG